MLRAHSCLHGQSHLARRGCCSTGDAVLSFVVIGTMANPVGGMSSQAWCTMREPRVQSSRRPFFHSRSQPEGLSVLSSGYKQEDAVAHSFAEPRSWAPTWVASTSAG